MKSYLGLSLAIIVLAGGFAYSEMRNNKLLTQQVADYARQNSQLLTRIEGNSLKNLETAKTLRSLQSEISNRDSQIAALSRQLETTQQQIDPDYQEIETEIRQQLSREAHTSNSTANSDPRISVLLQLSELDPQVMGEIMAVNAQYGDFIKNLDVSDERKEIVINALQNLITDQNQLRMEVLQEMQVNPQMAGRDDLRQQMQAISSPEAQLETLSYDLTESELNAFNEFQEQRQNLITPYSRAGRPMRGGLGGSAFFSGDVIQVGPGQPPMLQLLPGNPVN
tara:strand:+ start:366 stop:1208 length:843 start_codon:yes stop_codon:yes gene_type:complete